MKNVFCILFLFALIANCNADNGKSSYMTIEIISRPVENKGKVIPQVNAPLHYAIVSNALVHGIWEMGPDNKGMIVTTDTIKNFQEWNTYVVTQNCIDLGGNYIHSQSVEVNKKGLIDAIKLYEKTFVGKLKYDSRHQNENYAIATIIYAAGGPKLKL